MPDNVTVLRIGLLIESNGGYVLQMKSGVLPNTSVVLCLLPNNNIHPFVIHSYMEDSGACHTGEYFSTIEEALSKWPMRLA